MIPLPSTPKTVSYENNKAVFEIEGLYPGYGQTIGNSLRRVLLSSLKGAAITSFKIGGVGHEFSTIEGVMEDIVELTLNLKQLRFLIHEEGSYTIQLSAKGERDITGKDFTMPSQLELMNKDAHIATLSSKKANLELEAVVESGLGYVPVEARNKDKVEVGTIALDAAFSPVKHVNYEVKNMRVGDRTDYNRIHLSIETDGSVTPEYAFQEATKILVNQFTALTGTIEETKTYPKKESEEESTDKKEDDDEQEKGEISEKEETFLKMKLDDLKLSSRTLNVLREAGIKTVSGVMRKREDTLREIEGLGDKAIQEIKKALGNLGINLKK